MAEKHATSKTLSRGDLLAIAIGNVIGGGVMSMTGLAIGITGRSIILSYLICSALVTVVAMPQFFLSSTIRMNGGFYTQAALFGGKRWSSSATSSAPPSTPWPARTTSSPPSRT